MSSSRKLCSSRSVTPRARNQSQTRLTSFSGAEAPEVIPTTRISSPNQRLVDLGLVVDQVRRDAARTRRLDQAVRVRRVARADHEQQVDLREQLLDRPLPVRGRVTDVLALRGPDLREPFAEGGDHVAGLVDREGRLGDVRELGARRKLELGYLVLRLDQDDRVGNLAHRPDDLLVPGMADEDDGVAVGRVAAGLHVHLRHEGAGRVDRP